MDKIKKPFYKRWWFITLVILFLIGIIFNPSEEDRTKMEEEKIAEAEEKLKEKEALEAEKAKEEEEKALEKEIKEKAEAERKEAEELEKQRDKEEKAAEKLAAKEQKELGVVKKDLAKAEEEKQKELDEITEAAEKQKENMKESIKKSAKKIIKQDLNDTIITNIDVNENMAQDGDTYIVLPYLVWDVKNGTKSTREMLEMYSDHLAAKLATEKDIDEITVFWEVPYHLKGNNVAKFMYTRSGDGMTKIDNWFAPLLQ